MRVLTASILAAFLVLSGCAGTGSSVTRLPQTVIREPLDVVIGASTSKPSYWGKETSAVFAGLLSKTGAFASVIVAEPGVSAEADVKIHLEFGMTNGGRVTASAATGETLVSREISCGFKGLTAYPECVGKAVAGLVYSALDGNPLLARLQRRRAARPRPVAPVASASPAALAPAPASAGLSKEDIQRMMTEAVKAAQAAAPAVSAPASLVSDADTPRYRSAEHPDDYAVVVGVEKYTGLPEATYAERDARAVYEHLIALGWPPRNVALLTGAQATRGGLAKNLERWLPQNVSERSTVFFYYSGHGAPEAQSGTAYLVPLDGDPQYLEDTAYPVKRVYERLAALKARRTLVAIDSCFSGSGGRSVLSKGTRPLVGRVDTGTAGARTAALTASGAGQISGTIESQGHGLFTYYLLRGLNGAAADSSGAVTVRSLYDYLTPRVRDEAKRANRDQAPELVGDGADFRLR